MLIPRKKTNGAWRTGKTKGTKHPIMLYNERRINRAFPGKSLL